VTVTIGGLIIDTTSTFTQTGGTLSTVTSGNIAITSEGTSTLQTITSAGALTLNKKTAAATYTLDGFVMTVPGALTINAGATLKLGGADTTINNTTGTFENAGILELDGDETLTAFVIDTNTGTTKYARTTNINLPTLSPYYHLIIEPDSGTPVYTLQEAITVNGDLDVTAGTLEATATDIISVDGTLTIGATGIINATSTALDINADAITSNAAGSITTTTSGTINIDYLNGAGAYTLGVVSTGNGSAISVGTAFAPSSLTIDGAVTVNGSAAIKLLTGGALTINNTVSHTSGSPSSQMHFGNITTQPSSITFNATIGDSNTWQIDIYSDGAITQDGHITGAMWIRNFPDYDDNDVGEFIHLSGTISGPLYIYQTSAINP